MVRVRVRGSRQMAVTGTKVESSARRPMRSMRYVVSRTAGILGR